MAFFTLDTPHGLISITDTTLKNARPPLLLIHGNSSSSKIWHHMLASPSLTARNRLIAFDLPGHGASSDAPDADASYSMPGYAQLAAHILAHLNVRDVVVLGWSLGGHVAIELLALLKRGDPALEGVRMRGMVVVGTPPARGKGEVERGFAFADAHLSAAARREWAEGEEREFVRAGVGGEDKVQEWMEVDAKRTDGRARQIMFGKFVDGVGVDQRRVVEEEKDVLVGVVNGAQEPFVNLDYLDGIQWGRLWKGKCLRIEGTGHTPFWEKPAEFEVILKEYLEDVDKA
ncbi:alpha/beta-hydrolase [Corynespora cassiicola Philippines]|uniref:Alpha/beta-hydrolase n=1 Tax=Corynespora cassiicola Philippines TaxID=1448308 RepID=A0A2T2P6Q2_CORCC|nr:alpha/beta-hydrolase [Corynespora cassiicola Philippines]